MNTGEEMNSIADKTGDAFWGELLHHIVEKGRRTPKVQVERAVGPILGFFLDQAISDLLNNDDDVQPEGRLRADVVTLATEFPLKKPDPSNQSTNIDWLMYDEANNELLLVELKTETTSFRSDQLGTYLAIATGSPWCRMKMDFDAIYNASKSWKYQCAKNLLEKQHEKFEERLVNARARVLYLAPEATRDSFNTALEGLRLKPTGSVLAENAVKLFSFKQLAASSNAKSEGNFDHFRDKFFRFLRRLDEAVEECEADAVDSLHVMGKNYREQVSLAEVLQRCAVSSPVIVGFMGGMPELERQDVAHLENRIYKWDWADERGVGQKKRKNWIDGTKFVETVGKIRSATSRSEADSRRLSSCIQNALLENPELTLGQLIDFASSDSGIALDEMADKYLVEALEELPVRE
jgi:hypothetical protein